METKAIRDALVQSEPLLRELEADAGVEQTELQITSLCSLLAEPDEKVDWILDGILPSCGLSLLAGKPKAGKSTWARCLAIAVARGTEYLGRSTTRGPVLYLALEEKRSELKRHFEVLGATGGEPIFIHADRAPVNALIAAQKAIAEHKPALVIIDPLLKFTRVRDANDYAQVTAALEPLLDLARKSRAHVLLVYHAGKGEKADAVDSALGSTAFAAAVDTVLVLKRTERYRTLQTVQRYGADMPETVLNFDEGRRAVLLGVAKSEAETGRTAEAILDHMAAVSGHATEPEICEAVEGKSAIKRVAIRTLVEQGKLARAGGGKKGDPYLYSLSPQFSFSRSHSIPGTRKQETENGPYLTETEKQKLLPETIRELQESAKLTEQETTSPATMELVI